MRSDFYWAGLVIIFACMAYTEKVTILRSDAFTEFYWVGLVIYFLEFLRYKPPHGSKSPISRTAEKEPLSGPGPTGRRQFPQWNCHVEFRKHQVEIQKAASAEYDARFVMSATSPDRVRDTISPEAYEPNLGKKLIALWQHNADQPIGYWENMTVSAGKLIGDLKVAGTNLGLMIRQLVSDGVPLAASIGFRGRGEPNKEGGFHFKELELLECSIVSVPAHPKAVMLAKKFNLEGFVGENDKSFLAANLKSQLSIQRATQAIIAAKRTLKGIK